MKILRKFFSKIFQKNFFFKNFQKKIFQDFHYLDKKPLTWGCLYTLWEAPIASLWKNICRKIIFRVPEIPPLLGILGAWTTFKKAEMAKTLRNGLSMIEMNPLNHNWSDFMILTGRFLGSHWDRQLKFSAYDTNFIDHYMNAAGLHGGFFLWILHHFITEGSYKKLIQIHQKFTHFLTNKTENMLASSILHYCIS